MKIYLEVFGCTANKADANLIKGILLGKNHVIVEKIDESDLIIILTCTVINTTEQKILSKLRKYKKKGKKIIIAGCMASVQKEIIRKILPDTKFLKPQHSHHIVDLIEDKKIVFKEQDKTFYPKNYDTIFAPIAISEGCMFSCSYCITTIARGKLRSFPTGEIKKDVCYALKNGCREIQITSQDTSSYGLDKDFNLGDLLDKLVKIQGDFRIRVGMMNPYTCKMNLNSIIKAFEISKIYKFIHLPVQSGSNKILKKMNRKYVVSDFIEIVKKFREKYPDVTLSTDIIVGFPTETEDQFNTTINLINNIKPDITNITRFSARPGTIAKKMDGRIKTEIVKKRSKELTDICKDISYNCNKKYVGKKDKILITEGGKDNTFVGRSENYKPVVVDENVEIGSFYDVEITDFETNYLIGRLI